MRVVLDTSALLVSISRKSPFWPIFESIMLGKYSIVVSTEILLEYEEKITEKSTPAIAENITSGLLNRSNVEVQMIYFNWDLIENDPDDNKFVDCYLAAGADYLVSNDRHFRVLKPEEFPSVKVINVQAFLELVQSL
jgi:putative PIN family toxin of toxin-antitoxin system